MRLSILLLLLLLLLVALLLPAAGCYGLRNYGPKVYFATPRTYTEVVRYYGIPARREVIGDKIFCEWDRDGGTAAVSWAPVRGMVFTSVRRTGSVLQVVFSRHSDRVLDWSSR